MEGSSTQAVLLAGDEERIAALSTRYAETLTAPIKQSVAVVAATHLAPHPVLLHEVVELEDSRVAFIDYDPAFDATTIVVADDGVQLFTDVLENRYSGPELAIDDRTLMLLFAHAWLELNREENTSNG